MYGLWLTNAERWVTTFDGYVILMGKQNWFRWMDAFTHVRKGHEMTYTILKNEWQLRTYTGPSEKAFAYEDELNVLMGDGPLSDGPLSDDSFNDELLGNEQSNKDCSDA